MLRSLVGSEMCIRDRRYDEGGEGIAYHDDEMRFGSLSIRPDDNVDLIKDAVAWIKDGEWLEYTINASEGVYTINVLAASGSSNPKDFDLSINGTFLTNVDIQSTGSYGNYTVVTISNVFISGGENQVLRLDFNGGGFNLDHIEFIQTSNMVTPNQALQNSDINNPLFLDWEQKKNAQKIVLNLYPNPTQNDLYIEIEGGIPPFNIELYNNVGQQLKNYSLVQQRKSKVIDVSDLPMGIYYIRVYDAQQNHLMKRFIKME